MRHTSINKYEQAVIQFCKICKMMRNCMHIDCKDIDCIWFEDQKYLAEKSQQLSLFTKEGFYAEALNFISEKYDRMLCSLWWSDIRQSIETHFDSIRARKPEKEQLNWWGPLAEMITSHGWRRTDKSRYSPINRAKEFLYVKNKF